MPRNATIWPALIAGICIGAGPAFGDGTTDLAGAQAAADAMNAGGLLVEAERDTDNTIATIEFKYWRAADDLVRRVDVLPVTHIVVDIDDRTPDADDRAEFNAIAGALPANPVSFADALATACTVTTGGFAQIDYDFENGALLIEVILDDAGVLNTVHIDPATGEVVNVNDGGGGGGNGPIGLAGAVTEALALVTDGLAAKVDLDDDGEEIDVEILDPAHMLVRDISFDPATGALVKNELELDSGAEFAFFAPLISGASLSLLDGIAAAEAAFPELAFDNVRYDIENGRLVIKAEAGEFEVLIDVESGAAALSAARCEADVTTANTMPGEPGFGTPDGIVGAADIQHFVNMFIGGDPGADITTPANANSLLSGIPDGAVTVIDLQYYVNAFVAGCP